MRRSTTCPRCGAINDYKARRCVECGWRLIRSQDDFIERRKTVFGFPFASGCLPFILILIIFGAIFIFFGR